MSTPDSNLLLTYESFRRGPAAALGRAFQAVEEVSSEVAAVHKDISQRQDKLSTQLERAYAQVDSQGRQIVDQITTAGQLINEQLKCTEEALIERVGSTVDGHIKTQMNQLAALAHQLTSLSKILDRRNDGLDKLEAGLSRKDADLAERLTAIEAMEARLQIERNELKSDRARFNDEVGEWGNRTVVQRIWGK